MHMQNYIIRQKVHNSVCSPLYGSHIMPGYGSNVARKQGSNLIVC